MNQNKEHNIDRFYSIAKLAVKRFNFTHQLEEDLIQDIVIKCWQKSHSLENSNSLNAWIGSIARNACIDQCRKVGKTVNFDDLDSSLSNIMENKLLARTHYISALYERDVSSVRKNLRLMDDGVKKTIAIGFYIDGMSVQELSKKHDIRPNTVLSHLRRMRLTFSKKFHDTYDFSYLSDYVSYSH